MVWATVLARAEAAAAAEGATASRAFWRSLRRLLPRSLAARLSAVTAGVLAVALGMVSTVRTIALADRLYASTAQQMAADYSTLSHDVRFYPSVVAAPEFDNVLGLFASPSVGVLVIDPDGAITGQDNALGTPNVSPPFLTAAQYQSAFQSFENAGPGAYESIVAGSGKTAQVVVLAPAQAPGVGVTGVLEFATSVRPIERTVREQLEFDILAGLLALVGASTAIYFLLGRFLAPVEDMAFASDRIARGDLDVELPPAAGDDEVSRLSRAFSHMVRRIDAALAGEREEQLRMRAFLADASHSLRTPLTVLNGRLDLLLRGQSRDGDELEASLRALRVEGERMARIVRGLLLLARLDEEESGRSGPVDMTTALTDLRPRLESLAGERELIVRVEAGLTAWATLEAVETITTNLVENAARHTAESGRIELRAERDPQTDMARLRVLDTGSGIAEADLPHVFERFYRGAASAHRRDGGAGLGLSIVQRWAESLGGRVSAANRSDRQGAEFTVWLPVTPPPAPPPMDA